MALAIPETEPTALTSGGVSNCPLNDISPMTSREYSSDVVPMPTFCVSASA